MSSERENLLKEYLQKRKEHDEQENKTRELRLKNLQLKRMEEKFEEQQKAIQLFSMDIAEILKKVDEERYIVKVSARYEVNVSDKVDKSKLVVGTRVALDKLTQTIVRILPREVDPMIYSMLNEDPGKVSFNDIGGLHDQIRDLRESIELPITNAELFQRIGIKAPKGCLMYGPPGTGKTLIARALAANVDAKFLKVVASGIVDKYIGESARTVREMFRYARDNAPCIVFIDEIDAIAGKRFSEGTSADREIQRTLMELLNQMDGFDELTLVKVVFATNRPDVLDPAFLRPGRIDRKVEIPLPNESARLDILKIHAKKITTKGEINYEQLAKLSEDFNGADLRNICTEAGMFAIRVDRDYCIEEDFMKAARKIKETKKLETKLDYSQV